MNGLRRFSRRRLRHWQSPVAVGLLPIVFAVGAGLPLVSTVKKDLSKPYPCQACPCSCPDAEYCWRHCGCMTDQEKLAWAERNGVQPPDFVVLRQRARAGGNSVDARPACCCAKSPREEHTSRVQSVTRRVSRKVVLLSAVQRCRGLDAAFAFLSSALTTVRAHGWQPDDTFVGTVAVDTVMPCTSSLEPPDPPPRPTA
jgi:hypothetical protein